MVISAPTTPLQHLAHIGFDSQTNRFTTSTLDPSLDMALHKLVNDAELSRPRSMSAEDLSAAAAAAVAGASGDGDSSLTVDGLTDTPRRQRSRSRIDMDSLQRESPPPTPKPKVLRKFPSPLFYERVTECTETGCSELDLSGLDILDTTNFITHIVPSIRSDLNILELGFNQFSQLPANLSSFKHLEELSLDGNFLTELPASIQDLHTLTALSIAGNKLDKISAKIAYLTRLQKLNLSNNQLSVVPPSIVEMTQLTDLLLTGNPMRQLPVNLGSLARLELLDCQGCGLEYVPESIAMCTRLLELNFGNNHLAALPTDIGRLTRLSALTVADNKLTDLPVSIALCDGLVTLNISRNPFSNPNIVENYKKGTDHLLFWLEKRMYAIKEVGQPIFLAEGAPPSDPRAVPRTLPSLLTSSTPLTSSNPSLSSDLSVSTPPGTPPLHSGLSTSDLLAQQQAAALLAQQQAAALAYAQQQQLALVYAQQQQQQAMVLAYAQQLAQQQIQQHLAMQSSSPVVPTLTSSSSNLEQKILMAKQAGIQLIKDLVAMLKQHQASVESFSGDSPHVLLRIAQSLKEAKPSFDQLRALLPEIPPASPPVISSEGRSPELLKLITSLSGYLAELSQILTVLFREIQAASSTETIVQMVKATKQAKETLAQSMSTP